MDYMDAHELERKRNLARRMLIDSGCADPTDEEIDEVVAGAYRRLQAQQAKAEARAQAQQQARMEVDPDDEPAEDDDFDERGEESDDDADPEQRHHRELDEAERLRSGGANNADSVGARVSGSSRQGGAGGADAHFVNSLPAFPDFVAGGAHHTTTAATASNRRRSPDQAAAHGFRQGMGRAPETATYVARTKQQQQQQQAASGSGHAQLPLHQRRFEPLVSMSRDNMNRQRPLSAGASKRPQPQQQQHADPSAAEPQPRPALPQREREIQRLNRAAVNYTLLGLSSKVFAAVGNRIEQPTSSRSVLKTTRSATRVAGSTLPERKKTDPVTRGAALRERWEREEDTTRRSRKQLAWDVRQSMLM